MAVVDAAIEGVANLGTAAIQGSYELAGIREKTDAQEHESDNELTTNIFGTASNNTTAGWVELLSIDTTSKLSYLLIIAFVAAIYVLTNKKK